MSAVGYRIDPTTFDGLPAWRLSSERDGVQALIAARGATVIRWTAPLDGRPTELVDGCVSAAELIGQDGVRNGVLAPYTNRLADDRYRFAGRDFDVAADDPDRDAPQYHGFVREADTELRRQSSDDHGAQLDLGLLLRAADRPFGYPFDVDITIGYELSAVGLTIAITGENRGSEPAPFAAGWHPYFRLRTDEDTRLETWLLQVPAEAVIATDDRLIPLPAPHTMMSVSDHPELDFRRPRPVGDLVLDACFADLRRGADGLFRTELVDPATGAGLSVWQSEGYLHAFTGDTLARDPRHSIALEPVQTATNAFNDPQASVGLAPGASRTFRCGVELIRSTT
jgi:aldose 1-epimerase